MSDVVMSGSLGAFDVASILQAMSLSRQHTRLRLWSDENAKTGEIRMKAGQILQAQSSTLIGKDAFRSIVAGAHATFSVERCEEHEEYGTPLGSIASLLLAAHSEPDFDDSDSADEHQDPEESLIVSATLAEALVVPNEPSPKPAPQPRATVPPPLPTPVRTRTEIKIPTKAKKPPAQKSASVRKETPKEVPAPEPAPAAIAYRPRDFESGLMDRLENLRGIDFLILGGFGPAQPDQQQWIRPKVNPEDCESARFVFQTLDTATQGVSYAQAQARMVLEMEDRTIVGQCLRRGRAFVCGFDASLPLGYVRHICKILEPELERYVELESASARLAG